MGDIVSGIRIADLLDIGLIALLLYALFLGLKRARSAFVVVGLLVLGLVYLVAVTLNMEVTKFLFHGFFAVLLIAIIVIFQEDLRALLERIALFVVRWRAAGEETAGDATVDAIVAAARDLARAHTGALIVLQGSAPLSRSLQAGTALDGLVSEPLLLSLFDPDTAGHDGAAIVEGDRLTRFGCFLPVSDNEEEIAGRGTRHAAGLGVSERSDALCIVVSEERGTISVARDGRLQVVPDAAALRAVVDAFRDEFRSRHPTMHWGDLVVKHVPMKGGALIGAIVLWFFFSHGSTIEHRSFTVTVDWVGAPEDLVVASVAPPHARIVVSAPRRAFWFAGQSDVAVTAKLFDVHAGANEVTLAASDVALPPGITFVNVFPRAVTVNAAPAAAVSR